MKFPVSFTLGGYLWTVKTKPLSDKFGKCVLRKRTIYIDSGILNDERLLSETLLHELVHAVEMTYGLDLSEQDVMTLGVGLSEALRWVRVP